MRLFKKRIYRREIIVFSKKSENNFSSTLLYVVDNVFNNAAIVDMMMNLVKHYQ